MFGLSHLLIQFTTAFRLTECQGEGDAFGRSLTGSSLVSREVVHCLQVSSLYSGNMALGVKVGQDSELSHQKGI